MNIPVRTFLLASFLGMIPSSFVYAGIGAGLGHIFASGEPVTMHTLFSPRIYLPIIGDGRAGLAAAAVALLAAPARCRTSDVK
jgi:uncharacterized membrane protein YdjX (TVP38/TMEM64 family)